MAVRHGKDWDSDGCAIHFNSSTNAKQAHKYVLALTNYLQQAVYMRVQRASLHSTAPAVLLLDSQVVSNRLRILRFSQQVYATVGN